MRVRSMGAAVALATAAIGVGIPAGKAAPRDTSAQTQECPLASTGRSIVRFPDGVDAASRLRALGASRVETLGDRSTAVADLGGDDEPAGALRVDPEAVRHLHASNDEYRPVQWALDEQHVDAAVANAIGTGVTVAVLDSGVDGGHPDLAGQVLAGIDATIPSTPAIPAGGNSDVEGHGTFVSGIIAALRDNTIGVAGVAPGAKILPIRVADDTGAILSSAVVRGINLAVARGARVINMSFGGCGFVQAEQDAIDAAAPRAVLVASSGNLQEGREGTKVDVYPAAYRNVVGVGAALRGGGAAPYSVNGQFVDIAAPGGSGDGDAQRDIAGTDRAQSCSGSPCYTLRAGTSFAAPHVSAVMALVLSANPQLPPAEAVRVVQATAIDLGPPGRDQAFGEGRADALGAVALTMGLRPAGRLAGADRYATAASLSSNARPEGAPIAYLARGDVFSPDALAAGPAASHAGGPVLLTKQCELPPATTNELARLQPAQVVVLGGPNAVCDEVVASLNGRRVHGFDRYATAAALAVDTYPTGVGTVYLARGDVFSPDALVGGTAAGRADAPILLTPQCSLDQSTSQALDALQPTQVVVLGGSAAICDLVVAQLTLTGRSVRRIAGPDRYATAVAIGREAAGSPGGTVAIARGDVFSPDALTAAPWAVAKGVPLLLSLPCHAPPPTAIEVNDRDARGVVLAGGTAAVCDAVIPRYQ